MQHNYFSERAVAVFRRLDFDARFDCNRALGDDNA
jgi:hypothetical protein